MEKFWDACKMNEHESSIDDHLYINIENFENTAFKDSKYVLTSPKSLQACNNMNIKPSDIVSNSLAEAFNEIGTKNSTLPLVYQIFNEKEIERKINVSKIRMERLNIIKNQKEQGAFHTNTIEKFYNKQFQPEEKMNDYLSNSVISEDFKLSRLNELEKKLELLKLKEANLLNNSIHNSSQNYKSQSYDKTKYENIDQMNESFDPYFYTIKYPQKPVFDIKAMSLNKQAEYEEQFERTRDNSRRINEENQKYHELRNKNKLKAVEFATNLKEQKLAERSLRIFLDRQEKLGWREENLNRSNHSQMMKSLIDMTKIRKKEEFIDAKTRNNALRLNDLRENYI